MSHLTVAAQDEDGETIRHLKAMLGRANALCRIRFDRIKELELMLEAVGAGGVGQPLPQTAGYAERLLSIAIEKDHRWAVLVETRAGTPSRASMCNTGHSMEFARMLERFARETRKENR